MQTRKLFSVLLLMMSFSAHAQNMAAEGTYQFMTSNSKVQEVFTTETLVLIEANRKQNEVNLIQVGEFTWARIFSVNTIEAPGFIPVSDETIVISPNDPILNTLSHEE